MKIIELEDQKRIQLEILYKVASFCEDNGIRYYLAYGTLLGAVRHKGYIPWDDDIDIMMPRPDYIKFINTFNGFSNNRVISHFLDPNYPWQFAKVINTDTVLEELINYAYKDMGIYIDVFPIDGVSSIKKKMLWHYRYIKVLKLLLSLKRGKKLCSRKPWQNLLLNFSSLLCFVNLHTLIKKINSMASMYSFDESDNVAILVNAGYGKKEIIPKAYFSENVILEFEKHSFIAPNGYEKYLEHVYGDYMTLPPVEKRISHHAYKCKAYYK